MQNSLLFGCLLFVSTLFSQNMEIGILAGGSFYNGDIDVTAGTALQQMRPAGGIFFRYHPQTWLALRGMISAGTLYADEKRFPTSEWRPRRGFDFSSPIVELAFMPEIRPFSIGNVAFYGFVGIAGAYFNPRTNFNDPASSEYWSTPNIDADKAQQTSHITVAIPLGAGFQWFMTENIALGGELGVRKTFSDYFDGISQIAGFRSKDYYYFGGITLSLFFGNGQRGGGGMWQTGGKRGGGVSCYKF